MIPGAHTARNRQRTGLQAIGREPRICCAFQLAHGRFQFAVYRKAHAAIGRLGSVKGIFRVEQNRRGALHRRIDRHASQPVAPRVNQPRFEMLHQASVAIGRDGSEAHSVHDPS